MTGDGCRGRRRRKERILHTRISDRLDEALRTAADELRVPVSNLVRNVLEDVFVVVETVTENVGDLVDDVIEEADRVRGEFTRRGRHRHRSHRWGRGPGMRGAEDASGRHRAPGTEPPEGGPAEGEPASTEFPDVIGWQPIVLNASQSCGGCGRDLARGQPVYVGLGTTGPEQIYLCEECLETLD
jgi:hypothetical protein